MTSLNLGTTTLDWLVQLAHEVDFRGVRVGDGSLDDEQLAFGRLRSVSDIAPLTILCPAELTQESLMEAKLRQIIEKYPLVATKRSRNMNAVRGRGNKTTESRFRAALVSRGISGWHLHSPIPGRPDFVFAHAKIAVFCDGCFWHGCPLCGHIPKRNTRFWSTKIQLTQNRDVRTTSQLIALGFRVFRFWEHDIAASLPTCVDALLSALAEHNHDFHE